MKKIVATLSAAALAACLLAGCSQQTETVEQEEPASTETVNTQSERVDLEIAESGYYFDEYGYGHFAVIVENPNADWAAEGISVNVTSKDESGAILGTQEEYLTCLFANGKTAISGQTYSEGAATLEFQIVNSSDMWVEDSTQQAEYDSAFYVQSINETVDDDGFTTVAGEVVNTGTGDFSLTTMNAVFRAEDGSIVGGESTIVSSVPAGSTLPFSIDYISDVPAHASVEVYVDCGYPA